MAFNYYYDFEDCFQQSGGTGTTLTYVVGSNEELTEGKFYTIFSISNPNQRVCGENLTASTSTAATHYSEVIYEFDSCGLCLSANTQIISVTGITNWNGGNLTLVADSRYIKGDIIHVDVVYDLSGTTTFINSPAQIVNVTPYTSTGSSIPDLIFYTPYDSFQQVFESKGVYYLVEDCSGGTQSVILSKQELLFQNTVINLPYGDSTCKFVVTALTQGDYSDISGVTTVLNSSVQYRTCADCLSGLYSGVLSDEFEQNAYESDSINSILQTYDGSVIIGGSGFTSFTGSTTGNTYSVGNIFKLDKFGNPDFTFNKISSGCLGLFNNNYIYTNNNSNFTLDGDFTIEFWMYIGSPDTDAGIISLYNGDDSEGWEIRFDSSNIIFYSNVDDVTSTFEPQSNQWNHLAIVREGSNITLFLNGSGETSSFSTSTISASTDTLMFIGTNYDKTAFLNSSVANVRISNVAVYTGDFKPKTSPLTIVQEGSTNISSISGNQTTLLLLFKDSNSLLSDSSNFGNQFYSYNPNVYYLNEVIFQGLTTESILTDELVDSYLEIPLPSGYSLNFFGENYSSVYVGSNSYLTVGSGATEGGLILPDEIPSKIGVPGLFLSTFGNESLDNETFITSVSTGQTEDDKFLVQVNAEYSKLGGGGGGQCSCYTVLYDPSPNTCANLIYTWPDPNIEYTTPYPQTVTLLYFGCKGGGLCNTGTNTIGDMNISLQAGVPQLICTYPIYLQTQYLIYNETTWSVCPWAVTFTANGFFFIPSSSNTDACNSPGSYITFTPVFLQNGQPSLCVDNNGLTSLSPNFNYAWPAQCQLDTPPPSTCQCFNLYNTSGSIVNVTYNPCNNLESPVIPIYPNSYDAICSEDGIFDFSTPNVVVVSSLVSELEPTCDVKSDCKADCFCFTGYSNNGQTAYLHSYTDCFGNVESGGVNIYSSYYDQYNPFKWCAKIEQPISTSSNLTWGPTYSACTEYLTSPYNTLDYQCPDFEIPRPCVCMRVRNNTPITSTNPNPNIPGSGWAILSYEDCNGNIINENGTNLQLNVPPRANFRICAREILIANVNLAITNENILCETNNDGDNVCPCQCYKVDRNSQVFNALGVPNANQTYRYKKCQLPTSNDGTIPDVLSTFNPTDYICAEIYSISSTTINNILNTTIPVLITELDHACNADSINLNPNFCVPTPTPTPTKTKTPTPTKTKTPTPTKTKTQTKTPTPTKTKTPTVTKTPTMTKTPTRTVPACRCHNITNNGANSFYTARACNSLMSSNFQITALSSVQRCFIEGTFSTANPNISATPTGLCVNCGGGQFSCGSCPSPTPTKTSTPTKTVTRTVTRTVTPTKTATMTRTPSQTPLPILPGCIVLVNSTNSNNLWYYNYTANTVTQIFLPGNSQFIDIALSQSENRYFGLVANPPVYQIVYWDVDFSTGVITSGPTTVNLVTEGNNTYWNGLGCSLSGLLLYAQYVSTGPTVIRTINYLANTTQNLITLQENRVVSGDILATTTGKLIMTTTDYTSLYVEQYTTDNTPDGTFQDGEFNLTALNINFGPNTEVDIFIDNGTFYLMKPQSGVEELWTLSQDGATLTFVQSLPNIGILRGIASYPECHNFEFEFTDRRCNPLIAGYGIPAGNAGTEVGVTASVGHFNFIPNFQPPVINLDNAPVTYQAQASSVALNRTVFDIAHTFNLETNQGRMWILTTTPGNALLRRIFEWTISYDTMTGIFNTDYQRLISVGNDIRLLGGLTAIDNTTLIGAIYANNQTLASTVIEIDVSTLGDFTLTSAQITNMITLPVGGQTFNTTQGVVTTNTNIGRVIVDDLTLTDNNNLIVIGRFATGTIPAVTNTFNNILLQYQYTQGVTQPNFVRFYNDTTQAQQNTLGINGFSKSLVFRDGQLIMIRALSQSDASQPFGVSLVNLNTGDLTFLYQAISPGVSPGPFGSSSPTILPSSEENVCTTTHLVPNVPGAPQ